MLAISTSASTANNVIPFPPRGLFSQHDLFLGPSSTPTSTGIVEEIGAQSIEHIAAALGLSK